MLNANTNEKNLENILETSLLSQGYVKGSDLTFDKNVMLDTKQLLTFIKTSQQKEWDRYIKIYGITSEKQFITRLNKEISDNGLIKIFRQGIKDRGIHFNIVFFKPETSINEEDAKKYQSNIFSCDRQFHYSTKNNNTIDIVLLLNGIPIISLELKNQTTGQTIENAKTQFMYDRDFNEPFFKFNERNIIYFCVDNWNVCMTTKLKGNNTRFLPFDQGSNGPGNVGGKGNPINPNGYSTSYLWENILTKDAILEIIQKFIHLNIKETTDKETGKTIRKESIIFPRYHQLDVVRKLIADVKITGPGKNYLIQHSAGSGKSNSIAWLVYRLAGLHNINDDKIFDSVIVVTDRRVLDNQLQDTIYQFDHIVGVVERIDKNSAQLKDAINSGKSIIITTLQKFPVIYDEVAAVGNKNFAIICDEAHSSQTGIASQKLKEALGNRDISLEEFARLENDEEEKKEDGEDKLYKELASHGKHTNLSFFAFTATPKDKTLQLFGQESPDGKFRPFHIYSMRQAIDEGFILDVLQNYTTYSMYYKILKTAIDDPEVKVTPTVRDLKRFESLHPHNVEQKAQIMIEFFRSNTKHKINGHAKAMVVTSSRLHAVRYYYAFRDYITKQGYTDLDVLVAFSGTVVDKEIEYTEEGINKTKDGKTIRENQLREYFKTDDFNTLIVAEKYQTGFDEPLLQTMFVDKKLNGVKAVQTLSRLNRTAPGKDDTFVLDFANEMNTIRKSFEPYFESTVLSEGVDANIIYDIKTKLDEYKIWNHDEVEEFAKIFYGNDAELAKSGAMSSIIQKAILRYVAITKRTETETDQIKKQIRSDMGYFIRVYSFITQIERMFDREMQKFYVYLKLLLVALPKSKIDKVDVDKMVTLEYYRLIQAETGCIHIEPKEEIKPMKGTGAGIIDQTEQFSKIVNKINATFGTDFSEMDKVLEQISNDMKNDEEMSRFAKNNNQSTFSILFDKKFEDIAVARYQQNDKFFERIFSDEKFMNAVKAELLSRVYMDLVENKA